MGEVDLDPGEIIQIGTEEKDGPDQKANSGVEEEDSLIEEGSKEESLTKAPLPEDPVYLAKPKTKIKIDAIIAIKEAISQPVALTIIRGNHKRYLRERSLKTTPMPMEVLKNPNLPQPPHCPKPTKRP